MADNPFKKTKEALSAICKGITAPGGGCCGMQIPQQDRKGLQRVEASKKKTESVNKP